MMTEAIATGMRHATMSAADRQSELEWRTLITRKPAKNHCCQHLWSVDYLGLVDYLPPHTGARSRRQETRHFQTGEFRRPKVHMIGDVGKELPEDAELEDLVDMDIPGLVTPGEWSFDFVEEEVREQLSHLSRTIVGILGTYEPTVFETREMPRLVQHRHWDLDITEMEGARPQASSQYPVTPQHLPELNRQIEVLERAEIIFRSKSLYSAPVLFAPKKDGKLRLCIDYHRLNRQTLRDCYPTPVATDLIARTRGCKMFSELDLYSGFHQLRIRGGDQHKTSFVTPGGQYKWVTCPFGLSNTPSYFQRLMNNILHDHISTGYCV